MTDFKFNLSKNIGSRTITLKKNAADKIIFENDVAGQIEMVESKDNILFNIYKTKKVGYQYTRIVEKFEDIPETTKCQVTKTKYVYTQEGDFMVWKKSGIAIVNTINQADKPELPAGKNMYVAYTMSLANSASATEPSYQTTNYFTASDLPGAAEDDTLEAKDALYKATVIDKFGTGAISVTEDLMATITVANGNNAASLMLETDKNDNFDNVLEQTFEAVHNGDKFTGTYLNEIATSSNTDETFTLKAGHDTINYMFANGRAKTGNDVINLVKNEILTLNMLNAAKEQLPGEDDVSLYVNTAYQKKGNDIILKFTNENGLMLGKTTIKDYFKIAQDNVNINYGDSDYGYTLKEALELEDGIGYLGNADATKAQTLTGNFLNNTIFGGKGKDTIKAVEGDNIIIAGKEADVIYSGKGSDWFYISKGDAINGDKIHNADKYDSLYFLDENNNIGPSSFENNLILNKSGNNLTVNYNAVNIHAPNAEIEKVTFADYFVKNTELFNINNVEDYSTLTINQSAKGTIKGTNYNDVIELTGTATINTGNGNDTIKFYNVTTKQEETVTKPVTENVTTNIDGTGIKTFLRAAGIGETAGDMGTKTIVFKNAEATAQLNLLGAPTGAPGEQVPQVQDYIYSKSGNNIKIEGYYADVPYNPITGTEYNSYGQYIIKDFFKAGNNVGNVYIDGDDNDHDLFVNLLKDDTFLYQEGKPNNPVTFYDTEYNDFMLGGKKNDKYYFTNGTTTYGTDKVYDVDGNDTYNVSSLTNALYISDKAGKDTLIVSDTNAHSLYFGITLNGTSISNVGKDLQIFDKTKMDDNNIVGGITISDYIDEFQTGHPVEQGEGCLETVKINGNNINIDLNNIANSVAGWLSDNGYGSSAEVFNDEHQAGDIDTMLAIYTTGNVPNN